MAAEHFNCRVGVEVLPLRPTSSKGASAGRPSALPRTAPPQPAPAFSALLLSTHFPADYLYLLAQSLSPKIYVDIMSYFLHQLIFMCTRAYFFLLYSFVKAFCKGDI